MNIAERKNRKNKADGEDALLLTTLTQLRKELDHVHNSLNAVTDPLLIDGLIFEMNAIHLKYQFYMRLCKERGLHALPMAAGKTS